MKPLLFIDFNGVISYNNFWNSIYSEAHELFPRRKEINDFVFIESKDFVKEWMVGKHTSEEAHDLLKDKFGIDKEYLFQIFQKDAIDLDVSALIMGKLKRLKAKYKLILITDNMDTFSRFTLPNNPILSEVFDGIFISYNTGKLKKTDSGRIFKEIAQIFDGGLDKSIFIDDSKSNCDLFETLGGKSICVTGETEVLKELSNL
ncbi:MAG: hypothetical protein ABI721_00930 [Candidatus Dojkabacteria bacterium]